MSMRHANLPIHGPAREAVGLRPLPTSRRGRRRPSGSRATLRRLRVLATGLLVLAALVASGAELHHLQEDHRSHGTPFEAGHHGDLPVFSGGAHPDQPRHAEAAGQLVSSRCTVCLLQLHKQGGSEHQAPPAILPDPSGAVRPTAGFRPVDPHLLAGGSRGPPIG